MKTNIILLKRSLIAILSLIALYYLIALISALFSYPRNVQNNLTAISSSNYFEPSVTQSVEEISSVSFDYIVIGYRAGKTRASVTVTRKNNTFVVQQGNLLENKYKLISVDSEVAIFSQNDQIYQLSTKLNN